MLVSLDSSVDVNSLKRQWIPPGSLAAAVVLEAALYQSTERIRCEFDFIVWMNTITIDQCSCLRQSVAHGM